jgi:hypothetical protein
MAHRLGHTIAVNLGAVADCVAPQSALPIAGGGTIINVASRAAFRGDDPHAPATKGMVAYTRTSPEAMAAKASWHTSSRRASCVQAAV